MNLNRVFDKTGKGHQELRSPSHGLSPRARQLLLLVDGNCGPDQFLRAFARHELFAYMSVLQVAGFIRDTGRMSAAAGKPEQHQSGSPGLKVKAEPDTPRDSDETNELNEPIDAMRDHALRQLLDTIGPAGEPFALRVAKCRSSAELISLVPAMQSVVEVSRGPEVARQFAREIIHK